MNELVSIIVPIYNVEKYLDRCLKSIQMQSYEHIQVIMVDDGSTDGSATIAQKYADADSRFVLIHKPNGGLSSARNYGLQCVQGEFVSFVDSDDFLSPKYVTCLLSSFDNETDICIADYAIYDAAKERAYSHVGGGAEKEYVTTEEKKELIAGLVKPGSLIMPIWKNMYRTKFIGDYGLVFTSERLVYAEDMLFNAEAYARARKVKSVSHVVYYHLVVPGSLSQGYRENIFEMLSELHQRLKSLISGVYGNDFASQCCPNLVSSISSAAFVLCKCGWRKAHYNVYRLLQDKYVRRTLGEKNPPPELLRHKIIYNVLKTKSALLTVVTVKLMLLMSPIYRLYQRKKFHS